MVNGQLMGMLTREDLVGFLRRLGLRVAGRGFLHTSLALGGTNDPERGSGQGSSQ